MLNFILLCNTDKRKKKRRKDRKSNIQLTCHCIGPEAHECAACHLRRWRVARHALEIKGQFQIWIIIFLNVNLSVFSLL